MLSQNQSSYLTGMILAVVALNAAAIEAIRMVTGYSTVPLSSVLGFSIVTLASTVGFLAIQGGNRSNSSVSPGLACAMAIGPILLPWFLSRAMPDGVWQAISLILLAGTLTFSGVLLYKGGIVTARFSKGIWIGAVCAIVALAWLILGTEISPWTLERGLYGVQHKDTMFHASIAQMLGQHGVQAIGVDAYSTTPYHVLSHKIIWSLSALTATPVLQGYMLFTYLTGLPILLFFGVVAGAGVARHMSPNGLVNGITSALIAFATLAVFDIRSFLASESYLVSLIFFFLFVYVAVVTLDRADRKILPAIVVSGILLLLASQAKISTGAVMVPMAITYIVILAKFRIYSFAVAPMIFLPILYLVLRSQALDEAMGPNFIDPFHYLIRYRSIAQPQLLFAALTAYALWRLRSQVMIKWRLLLILLAGFSAGFTAACLVFLPAGSAYYFAGPGLWCVALAFAGCLRAGFIASPKWQRGLLALLGVAFVVDAAIDVPKFQKNGQSFKAAYAVQGAEPYLGQVATAVRQLAKGEKHGVAVHMASTNAAYWDLTEIEPRKNQCWATAFYMPAVTGLPSINGLPPLDRECETPYYYGLSRHIGSEASPDQLDRGKLCQLAKGKSINTVLLFADGADGQRIDCNAD